MHTNTIGRKARVLYKIGKLAAMINTAKEIFHFSKVGSNKLGWSSKKHIKKKVEN